MKKFNKVYLVKYIEIIGIRQVTEDIKASREEIGEILHEHRYAKIKERKNE